MRLDAFARPLGARSKILIFNGDATVWPKPNWCGISGNSEAAAPGIHDELEVDREPIANGKLDVCLKPAGSFIQAVTSTGTG